MSTATKAEGHGEGIHQSEHPKRASGSGAASGSGRRPPSRPQQPPQRQVKLERGTRWFCAVGALLLAAACFLLAWSWIAIGPAAAYRHAAECPANAPTGASCMRYSTAVVKKVEFNSYSGSSTSQFYTMVLAVSHDSAPVTVNGVVTAPKTSVDAPKVGATVRVDLWQGRVVTVTSALGTSISSATPAQDQTEVFICAIGLLLAALGCLKFSRPGWFGRPIAPLRWSVRAGLAVVAAGCVVYAVGAQQFGVYLAGIGTGAILLWALPCAIAIFGHDWMQEHVQPAGAGVKSGTTRAATAGTTAAQTATATAAAKPKQPAEKRPPAATSSKSAYRNQDRRSDGCPVSEADQAWIEQSLYWFTTQFGYDPVQRRTLVPTADFIPADYAGTDDDIRRLFAIACPIMGTSTDRVALRFVGGPSLDPEAYRYVVHNEAFAAGVFINDESGYVIELDREIAANPGVAAATIAHELGHVRLNGDKGVDPGREDAERLTDLVTVFFGFGVFNANAAFRINKTNTSLGIRRLGYMDQRMFGYALACYCRMRQSPRNPPWVEYLDEVPREALKYGLEFLAEAAPYGGFPTQQGKY
jgi:hypothetical protein